VFPTATSVVSGKQMQTQQIRQMSEALREDPGGQVTQSDRQEPTRHSFPVASPDFLY
jgi:outer membrane receptor for ferric coprogen and ferric-rhodotorulic acid